MSSSTTTTTFAIVALAGAAAFVGCFLPDFERIEGKPVQTGAAGPGSTGAGAQGSGGSADGGAGVGGGTGGDGGAASGGAGGGIGGSAACVDGPGLPAACTGLGGPPMVGVPIDGGGAYCIDAHEVTNTQYAAFLLGNPMPGNQPAHCAWNTDFVPPGWTGMFAPGEENLPVGNVDWCDAAAYCASVGKRLCGKVGGGPAPKSLMVDAINEQWFRSCSEGGIRTYPYGAAYAPMACNGDDFGADAAVEVKSAVGCEGAYCGIFDMVGNVGEWVDMCDDPPTGEGDLCFVLGGDYNGKNDMQQTECLTFADLTRNITSPTIGFRCCQDE